MRHERGVVAAVRRACSPAVPRLVPHLRDADAEVRLCVAEAIRYYPEHAAVTLPALEAAEAVEADDEVRKAIRASRKRLAGQLK